MKTLFIKKDFLSPVDNLPHFVRILIERESVFQKIYKDSNKYKYIQISVMNMANRNITLSVDSKTYEKYSKYCRKNGLIISKKFELMMQQELKKNGDKK